MGPGTLQPTATLRGHTGSVVTAAMSHDGTRLFTAGLDSTVFIWDLNGNDRMAQPVSWAGASDELSDLHKADRARTVLVSLYPGAGLLEVDDMTSRDGPASYTIGGLDFRKGYDLDLDDSGQTAAILEYDQTSGALTARVFDIATRRFRPFTIALAPDIYSGDATLSISADGRTVTTIDASRLVRRWDATDGSPRPGPAYRAAARMAFAERSPDDRMLLLSGQAETMELVDLSTMRRAAAITITGGRGLLRPAFSPGGQSIAVGTNQGEIVLADARTGRLQARWPAAAGRVGSVAFTPDGRYIVSGQGDGKATVLSTDQEFAGGGVMDVAHGATKINVLALGDDRILTINPSRPSLIWSISPSALLARACAIVGRELTHDEWTALLPNRPYQRTCPENP